MKSNTPIVTVKKVLRMINNCQDHTQINECKFVVDNYIKSAKKKGIANLEDLSDRLSEELLQREEALMLVKIFNKNV